MSEYSCPHCKQSISDDEALLCHFCGESLRRTSSGAMGKMTAMKWLIAAVVLGVLLMMLMR